MSTQRMENRSTPATYSTRGVGWDISNPETGHGFRGTRYASRPEGRPECDGFTKTPVAQVEVAHATGNSAPPVKLASFHNESGNLLETPAVTSLQSDSNDTLFAGTCRSLSPEGARRAAASQQSNPASFPNQTTLPVLRVSIRLCRGYRQH
jgi:hypothetical protein